MAAGHRRSDNDESALVRSKTTMTPSARSSPAATSRSTRSGEGRGFRGRRAELGRRHGRHALRPLSRDRRAAQHPRQARRLHRHPAADRRHAARLAAHPMGPPCDSGELVACGDARPRLRRDELQHLPGRRRPAALLQVRQPLATPTRRSGSRRSSTTSTASLSARRSAQRRSPSGSATARIFPARVHFTKAFERYLESLQGDLRGAARSTGGCSPSTSSTSRPSIRPSCRTGAPTI